jgi:hypothetical protein
LTELFLIVRYCQVMPLRWTRIVVMAIYAFSLIYDNTQQVQGRAGVIANQPSQEMLELARSIDQPGGIMAPWWLSPGLLYFSGQPIVSGSSHCGISGIVASAQFFTATSWIDAQRILNERKVRWIVVFDNPQVYYPLLNSSRGIMGLPYYTEDTPDAEGTVAQMLVEDRTVPTSFRLHAVTPQFKLYEYTP